MDGGKNSGILLIQLSNTSGPRCSLSPRNAFRFVWQPENDVFGVGGGARLKTNLPESPNIPLKTKKNIP